MSDKEVLPLSTTLKDKKIKAIHADSQETAESFKAYLVVECESGEIYVYRATCKDKELGVEFDRSIESEPSKSILRVSNGAIVFENQSSGKIEIEILDKSLPSLESQTTNSQADLDDSDKIMSEEEVLKLTIDPKKVTAEELDIYENLMKG